MRGTIDFENPENVSGLNLVELYKELLLLRDDPEKFKEAETRIKKAFMEEQIKAGADRKSLEESQRIIDKVVSKSENAFQGAANVFTLMTHSFAMRVLELLDQRDIEKAIGEADLATVQ